MTIPFIRFGAGYNPGPLTQIQPFTYGDGITFAKLLYELKKYIVDDIVPYINTFPDQVEKAINDMIAAVDEALEAQTELVDAKLAAQDVENDAKIAALTEYVNEQIALIIGSSVEVQDAVVNGIFSDDNSATRGTTDQLYAAKSAEAAVASIQAVLAGRLSETTLDARFNAKADATRMDTAEDDIAVLQEAFDDIIDDVNVGTDSTFSSSKIMSTINGRIISGNYVDRPGPNTVPTGTQFACIDVPELYLNTGGAWTVIGAGGNMIGYAEQIPITNATDSTGVIVPGFTSTFRVGDRPIEIEVSMRLAIDTANSVGVASVMLDTVEIFRLETNNTGIDKWESYTVARQISGLVPNSVHTVTVAIKRGVGGTGTVRTAGDTTNPNSLKVRTV